MPIPAELRLDDPRFWAMYFFESDDDYLDEEEVVVCFPVGAGHSVELSVSDGYFDVGVRPPGAEEAVSVGWDDEAHFHPHLFRWDELDLVCRAAALVDPSLRHPGPALALLGRFLVISGYDDVDVIGGMLHAAFTGLRPGGAAGFWPEARKHGVERSDFRREGVVWHRDVDGNHRVGKDVTNSDGAGPHSTRVVVDGESGFPWTDWRSMLDQAERTLAAAVDPRWFADIAVARLLDRAVADRDLTAAPELGRALVDAGCGNLVVLGGLTEPVHPAETWWVLELLSTAPRGALLRGLAPATDARSWWPTP
ncbi:hypothetical protein FHS29_006649 [Saccharothrix tamanrassetensis]|uniref:Uncharacterized protein n=1 Tax=Saccharothrix tamanrassetensis TaxID=1051531 RepID=A0A841CVH9_9PSEU|nr:hypothetical protein [Saccharothrix tamanrassetensis]MBB5960027.1 hypothetical protein [Saccharothrix tamanrassetensis]